MEVFGEIALKPVSTELFETLSSEEKVFVYYLFRAGLPCNRIYGNQMNTHSNIIIDLFLKVLDEANRNEDERNEIESGFIQDIKIYLVHLLNPLVCFLR